VCESDGGRIRECSALEGELIGTVLSEPLADEDMINALDLGIEQEILRI
jgi:hypothetical protein